MGAGRDAQRETEETGSRQWWKGGAGELRLLPVERIDTPRHPARRFLGDIAGLADSMQDFGLQQPISVRVDGNRFILTSGLRRLAAARLLRWATIPAFVRNVSADDAYVLDLVENLQRQDLTAEEEADALRELIRTRGWTLQQVADAIKRSIGYVSKRVRLFEDDLLRDAVVNRGMPISTAEELLSAPPEQRPRLIERALAEGWDQVKARDAISSQQFRVAETDRDLSTMRLVAGDRRHDPAIQSRKNKAVASRSRRRPGGLTRAIREFHRLLNEVRTEDLTPSDRAALRALFRDLVLLARAPTTRRTPVFPPLPRVGG